jgi:hypothetical protein
VGWLKATHGRPSGSSPLRSDVLVMARQGGWTGERQWPKTLKTKLNPEVAYQAPVHSGQMVLVVVRQGGWTKLTVAESTQMKVRKRLQAA